MLSSVSRQLCHLVYLVFFFCREFALLLSVAHHGARTQSFTTQGRAWPPRLRVSRIVHREWIQRDDDYDSTTTAITANNIEMVITIALGEGLSLGGGQCVDGPREMDEERGRDPMMAEACVCVYYVCV